MSTHDALISCTLSPRAEVLAGHGSRGLANCNIANFDLTDVRAEPVTAPQHEDALQGA